MVKYLDNFDNSQELTKEILTRKQTHIWGTNSVSDLVIILGALDEYIEHYSEKSLIPSDIDTLLRNADSTISNAVRQLIKLSKGDIIG